MQQLLFSPGRHHACLHTHKKHLHSRCHHHNYRGGFCLEKLTLRKILPCKNSVSELKNGGPRVLEEKKKEICHEVMKKY
jgi:hypothetical protein